MTPEELAECDRLLLSMEGPLEAAVYGGASGRAIAHAATADPAAADRMLDRIAAGMTRPATRYDAEGEPIR